MSEERISMDLLDDQSGGSSDGEGESSDIERTVKPKKRFSVEMIPLSRSNNAIHPTDNEGGRKSSVTGLTPVDKSYNAAEAMKDMIGVVIDPASRKFSGEFEVLMSLHQAAREGDVESINHYLSLPNVKRKINALDEEKLSPLHYASRYNNIEAIELLLANKADVNVVGDDGLLPIHYAARYHKKRKIKPLSASTVKSADNVSNDELCESKSVIMLLIEAGAKVNGRDKYGMTPLHYAAMRGNEVAAVDLLTISDVEVDNTTPLHYSSLYGHLNIVKLLIESGANLRTVDNDKNTPLHFASDEGHLKIAEYLLSSADEKGGWPEVTQMVADRDDERNTALHRAVENGHTELVKILLSKGANVNSHRKNFVFPLHQAATNGNLEIVKFLVQSNARIDGLNVYQSTPLHRAAAFSHIEIVEYLLMSIKERLERDVEAAAQILVHKSCRRDFTDKKRIFTTNEVTANDDPRPKLLRSSIGSFNFKSQCFLCGRSSTKDTKHPERNTIYVVTLLDFHRNLLEKCRRRDDNWSEEVFNRLNCCNDLVADEGRYHKTCLQRFMADKKSPDPDCGERGRPRDEGMFHWFEMLCIWLEIDSDAELHSLKELHDKMSSFAGKESVYCTKRFKQKLQDRYGNKLYFADVDGKPNVACFQGMADFYLNEMWKEERRKDKEKDAERIVTTAAKVIMAEIRETKYDTSNYPKTLDISDASSDWIPKLLKTFLQVLIRSDLKQNSVGQIIVQAAKPNSSVMPIPFGLAVELDHVFRSKWLLDELYQLGFSSTYTKVNRFKQSAMASEDATQASVTLPPGTFSQHVADNVDNNLCTLDGKNTLHGMGVIQVSTNENGLIREEKPIKRLGLQRVVSVTANKGIPIEQYIKGNYNVLSKKVFCAIRVLKFDSCITLEKNIDLLWEMSFTFSDVTRPNWLATNVSVEEPPKDSHVEIDPEREEIENSERNVDIVEDESLDKNGDSPRGEKRKSVDSGESEPEIERGDDNEKDSCLPVVLGAKLEAKDRDGYTPLLWATCNGHPEVVSTLINQGADVTATDKCEKTAIFISAEENRYKVLEELMKNEVARSFVDYSDKYDNSPLHAAAGLGYVNIVKENKLIVGDEDEDSNTALHLAALKGHFRVIKLLLNHGADIEALNCELWTALDCAAANGHLKSVRILLDEDAPIDPIDRNKTTPLHLAAKEGYANVVKILLDHNADVSRRDARGMNCLDISIHRGKKDAALVIVNHEKWMEALRNERKDAHGIRETPLRELIKRMPEVAEVVFKRCISTNGLPADHQNLEVTFNYEFLDDAFTCYNYEDADKLSLSGIYDENGKVLPSATLYSQSNMELKMNHPLLIMARVKRQGLLGHPLCTSLLEYKWKLFGRYVFYGNLLIYTAFLILLTGYALYETDPYTIRQIIKKKSTEYKNYTMTDVEHDIERSFVTVGRSGIIALVVFHIFREMFQLYQRKSHYFDLENLMEWMCYMTALLYVVNLNKHGIKEPWQWEIGAVAVFLAWADLVMIMRKFPFLGIYVVMFTDILKTFSRFFIIFFLFVIAFALGFHLLLHKSVNISFEFLYNEMCDQKKRKIEFRTMEQSLIKTSVMMIGEFEFDTIFNVPYGDKISGSSLDYPGLSLALFCIFIIVMSIILMNLLVGLAVDDIKAVAEQAALKRLAMQADLVLSVEIYLPKFLRKRFIRQKKTLRPNRRYKYKLFTYVFQNTSEYLDSIANALSYKEEDID
ncbi:Transient receptor potential cation channel subfamily A member 1 [Nymphon striatum]|nr:Transient receptor potential cation channel subfamily A member 1 [Nymphon striatum]